MKAAREQTKNGPCTTFTSLTNRASDALGANLGCLASKMCNHLPSWTLHNGRDNGTTAQCNPMR